jgi:molybdenum cofactor synthesis domain-containing protein
MPDDRSSVGPNSSAFASAGPEVGTSAYRPRTAAALVIGNELLSGKVQEANVLGLATSLRAIGILFKRVVIVPDELALIASEVASLSQAHDVVFTSGGVGPTHDDVTIEAVARAFGVRLVCCPEIEAILRAHYGKRCTESHLRMALVPDGAELATQQDLAWPTIIMRNVWMLPGVPEVFRMKLPLLRARLGGGRPFVSQAVYTRMDEGDLKPLLDRVVAEYPTVEVGSYPKWFDATYTTKITFDGVDPTSVGAAARAFVALLPSGEPQRIEPSEL